MIATMRTSFVTAACLLAAACGNPIGPIAGGKLDGQDAAWPDDWQFSDVHENVLLETDPTDPYSVTVWGVHAGSHFYVTAADGDSRWVTNIYTNNEVVLSVSGRLYAASASEVMDEEELARVLDAYIGKYDISPEEGTDFIEQGGVVFRLTAR